MATLPPIMYQRILVPLDGSDAAEFAIPHAAGLARNLNAELVLLYLEYLSRPIGDAGSLELDRRTPEQIRQHLTSLRNQLRAEGVQVQEHIIASGKQPDTMLNFVENERIGVIVMTTHGRMGLVRGLFGDNIEQALNSIPIPIMLIRPTYHSVIVPLDGSKWSESAIPKATEIARTHQAEIVLLHVYQSPVSSYADQLALAGQQQMADQNYEQMHEQLISLRNTLRMAGLRAREQMIRSTNPVQAIVDFVESEEGMSMVVMSTHGRTGLSRLLAGSVAQQVIKQLHCPVTLVRPESN